MSFVKETYAVSDCTTTQSWNVILVLVSTGTISVKKQNETKQCEKNLCVAFGLHWLSGWILHDYAVDLLFLILM